MATAVKREAEKRDSSAGSIKSSEKRHAAESSSKTSSKSGWLLSFGCLLITGTLVAISTNLAKIAGTTALTPYALLAWSVLGAAVVHIGITLWRQELPPLNRRSMEYFLVAGLITLVAPYLINFAAVPKVGASFVALSIAFPPLYTYIAAIFFKIERFQAIRALGVALALGGAGLLAFYKLAEPNAEILWIVATLAVPVILAAGNIYRTLRWVPDAEPADLAPGMLVVSAIILFAVSLLPGFSLAVPMDSSIPLILIIAQTVTFSVMYVFFFLLQKIAGPVYLSLIGSVTAVVGAAIAILLLGEEIPQGLTIAAGLIAIGIFLVTRSNNKSGENDKQSSQPNQSGND